MDWAKDKISNYLEPILALCRKNNPNIISHHEYTGSFYENLKTETPDEIDIMVALKGKEKDFEVHEDEAGYARLKIKDFQHPLRMHTRENCLTPEKVRQFFFGLVQKTLNDFQKLKEEEGLQVDLIVSANGPAVTLVITDKQTEDKENKKEKQNENKLSLSADLVPSLLLSDTKHYVAKPKPEEESEKSISVDKSLLWRQSFSLSEKELIKKMDKPKPNRPPGCRHELVRIAKTFRRKDSTLAKLSSYHIKTAFLHYCDKVENENDWDSDKLGERFIDFLKFIMEKLQQHNLPNYFIPELNLLQEFQTDTLTNIEKRLSNLAGNPRECTKRINKL